MTPDQVDLLKRTICKGSTDDELRLFVNICERLQLDPFTRQLHAIKRWDSAEKRETMAIQVGIDGFRLTAERTGQYDGQDPPEWCGEDGVWRDTWPGGGGPPMAARVRVYRRNHGRPSVAVAHWAEYAATGKTGQPIALWKRMPALMLSKCAEALALRKAFPAELSGVYSAEEMDQAGAAAGEVPGSSEARRALWDWARALAQQLGHPQRWAQDAITAAGEALGLPAQSRLWSPDDCDTVRAELSGALEPSLEDAPSPAPADASHRVRTWAALQAEGLAVPTIVRATREIRGVDATGEWTAEDALSIRERARQFHEGAE
jgi:phage recombination protein Bet